MRWLLSHAFHEATPLVRQKASFTAPDENCRAVPISGANSKEAESAAVKGSP